MQHIDGHILITHYRIYTSNTNTTGTIIIIM